MRRAAKVDDNHGHIVSAFRAGGALVQDLSGCGEGVPDLLLGISGQFVLVEVKDGHKPPSARKLTTEQQAWHNKFHGYPVHIVTSELDAFEVMRLYRRV